MSRLQFHNSVSGFRAPRAKLTRLAEIVLRAQRVSKSVNLVLVADDKMRQLNHQFRGKNKTTDVLSFALEEDTDPLLGEIYISVPEARRNADRFGRRPNEELLLLFCHGLLHLCGIHHANPAARAAMQALEEKYLRALARDGGR